MDASDLICLRCSKPVTPETAAPLAGRIIHMRCLAEETRLESIEQQDTARRLVECAKTAVRRAAEIVEAQLRRIRCPACGEPFARRSVSFQGDQLVHAACRRPGLPPPSDSAPAA